jgi:DNA-binding transcriptional ArsR family regulator
MLRQMANNPTSLDTAFHALADPTRRAVVSRLIGGPASVTELAQPFPIGLPTFMKHLKVLEDSGLIVSGKTGRVRTCHLKPAPLARAEAWLAEQRALWEGRADRLVDYVENRIGRDGGDDDRS